MKKQVSANFLVLIILLCSCSNSESTVPAPESALHEASIAKEGMTVVFRNFIVDDLFQMLVPRIFEVNDENSAGSERTTLSIVGMKYLKGSSDKKGSLIAVAFPGQPPEKLPDLFSLIDEDKPLDEIGKNVISQTAPPSWVVVMKVVADWSVSKLNLTVFDGQAAVVKNSEDAPPYVSKILQNKSKPFRVAELDTSNIKLRFSDDREVLIKAQGEFLDEMAAVYLFPSDFEVNYQPVTSLGFSNVPVETNVIADVRPFFVKNLLNKAYAKPLSVTLPNSTQSIVLNELEYEPHGATSTFDVRAKRELDKKAWFRIQARYGGEDAKLDKLELLEPFNCGDMKPLECLEPKTVSKVLVGLLQNTYRGKLLRSDNVSRYVVRINQDINRIVYTKYNRIFVSGDALMLYGDWRGNLKE